MSEAEVKPVPAVIGSIAKVLAAMSVEKGGVLPGNMGGKPYITAVDLSAEAKRQFVENDLIILPSEKVISHEVINNNNRLTVAIVVEGTYTIISTKDGSHVVTGGVGDGLAIGTAVSSNIASTNALKNALLRLFLVTEQSVEDAAKDGVPEEKPAAAAKKAKVTPESIKADIAKIIAADDNSFTGPKVNDLGDKLIGTTEANRKWTVGNLEVIKAELDRLVAQEQLTGEVAEV